MLLNMHPFQFVIIFSVAYLVDALVTSANCASNSVAKTLSACNINTASSFCQSFISSSVPTITTTSTVSTTTTTVPRTTTTTVTTSTSSATITKKLVTITAPTVTYSTTLTTDCPPTATFSAAPSYIQSEYGYGAYDSVPPQNRARNVAETKLDVRAPKGSSCGLSTSKAQPISTGCRCFLTTPTTTATTTTTFTATSTSTISKTKVVVTVTKIATTASTTTVTPSTTTTFHVCPTADTSCGNTGLNWAYYRVPPQVAHDPNSPARPPGENGLPRDRFEPASYKTMQPDFEGTAQGLDLLTSVVRSGDPAGYWDLYGTQVPVEFSVIQHTTYFIVPASGTYTFNLTKGDDYIGIWGGSIAYSGWSASNVATFALNGAGVTTVNLNAGAYYPIRILYANSITYGTFNVDIYYGTGSNIVPVLQSGDKPTPYFITNSCDDTTAPTFPPFGSET